MQKWSLCLVWMILLLPAGLQAQSGTKKSVITKPSDIREAFQRNRSQTAVALDSRRSFVSRQDVNMLGIRAGLDFDGLVRVGGGVYLLFSDVYQQFSLTDPATGAQTTVSGRLHFSYVSAFFEPVLLQSKRWEVSFPLHLGIGDTYYEGAGFELSRPRTVVLSETSVTGHYKIFPWIGLSGGVGYRRLLRGNNLLKENFHAPIYMFGIKFFASWIYLRIFKPEQLEEW